MTARRATGSFLGVAAEHVANLSRAARQSVACVERDASNHQSAGRISEWSMMIDVKLWHHALGQAHTVSTARSRILRSRPKAMQTLAYAS